MLKTPDVRDFNTSSLIKNNEVIWFGLADVVWVDKDALDPPCNGICWNVINLEIFLLSAFAL